MTITIHNARKRALKLFDDELRRLRRRLRACESETLAPGADRYYRSSRARSLRAMITRTERQISMVTGERDLIMRACDSHSRAMNHV